MSGLDPSKLHPTKPVPNRAISATKYNVGVISDKPAILMFYVRHTRLSNVARLHTRDHPLAIQL